jgi:hypothetical protein
MKKTFTQENSDFYSLHEDETELNVREKDSVNLPSESVVRNILNYSRALMVFHTRNAGLVKLILN